jgi:hypothetical protein
LEAAAIREQQAARLRANLREQQLLAKLEELEAQAHSKELERRQVYEHFDFSFYEQGFMTVAMFIEGLPNEHA